MGGLASKTRGGVVMSTTAIIPTYQEHETAPTVVGELQTQPAEHQSFVETLRRWWRGGRP